MYHVINTFLGILIMTIGIISFAKIVLNTRIKIPRIKLTLTTLSTTLIYTITYLNFDGTFKTIIIFFVTSIVYKYIFKIQYLKSIYLTLLYIIILLLPDIITLLFVTKILHISKEYYYTVYAGSVFGNLTVCILFIIITYTLRGILRKTINYKLKNNKKIILSSILTFICIGLFFYSLIKEYATTDNIVSYIIAIIVIISILLTLIKEAIQNNILSNKYDKILEFMTTYEEEVEKQRVLRHETKNEFVNIKGQLLDNNKKDKIIEYIDGILNDKSKMKYEEYAKFQYLPPNGIKGLCYLKVQEAQEEGIIVGINISPRIKNSNIYKLNIKEQRNFARIIGVFLDNAIEASKVSINKQLGLEVYSKDGEFQMIISNSYNNEIDELKIGKDSYSTKGKNRGHGLLLVKNILKNNDMFEIKTEINEKLFIQYITIKNLSNI